MHPPNPPIEFRGSWFVWETTSYCICELSVFLFLFFGFHLDASHLSCRWQIAALTFMSGTYSAPSLSSRDLQYPPPSKAVKIRLPLGRPSRIQKYPRREAGDCKKKTPKIFAKTLSDTKNNEDSDILTILKHQSTGNFSFYQYTHGSKRRIFLGFFCFFGSQK